MKTVGIFDSGIGGQAFADALLQAHPELKVTVKHDTAHMPYGEKPPEEIQQFTEAAIEPLLGSDVIVLACNTATAYAIDYLRQKYPQQIFVGFEPALKVAAGQTRLNVVAVLATPATLASPRYQALKTRFATNLTILEPDVSQLARQIETNTVDWEYLQQMIEKLLTQQADIITLGCTHYHLIKNRLEAMVGKSAIIITPTEAVIRRIEDLLGL